MSFTALDKASLALRPLHHSLVYAKELASVAKEERNRRTTMGGAIASVRMALEVLAQNTGVFPLAAEASVLFHIASGALPDTPGFVEAEAVQFAELDRAAETLDSLAHAMSKRPGASARVQSVILHDGAAILRRLSRSADYGSLVSGSVTLMQATQSVFGFQQAVQMALTAVAGASALGMSQSDMEQRFTFRPLPERLLRTRFMQEALENLA